MRASTAFSSSLWISALTVALAGCGGGGLNEPAYGGGRTAGAPPAEGKTAVADSAEERPGLGTQWGETRTSRIENVPFERGNGANPFTTGVLWYNDEEGATAMASGSGFARNNGGLHPLSNGAVQFGLRDENGAWLTGFTSGGKDYVVGEAGRRYSIVVRNNTPFRIEVVLSVDGLDVLDGKDASFSKRGYIVDARGEIEIEGFRQSTNAVAAFRFGSVRGSYAGQKYGDTTNVGVIGIALFHERGTEPWKWNEIQRRQDANPFPGQYATPP